MRKTKASRGEASRCVVLVWITPYSCHTLKSADWNGPGNRQCMSTVFDCITRTETCYKRSADSIFAHWNRSARRSSEAARELIEDWFARIPITEQRELRSRFRNSSDAGLAAAFQELCFHELFLRAGCKPTLHATLAGTAKQPDFLVQESDGSEFLLEAKSSTEISSGPENSLRRSRILDFLRGFKCDGFSLGVDEVTAGSRDLSQRLLANHTREALSTRVDGNPERILIPPLETDDGWKIRLTAFSDASFTRKSGSVLYKAWSRTWNGPSCALLNSLKKKGGRYGSGISMPFVIAINSFDPMLVDRDYEEPLLGERGFWGSSQASQYRRVSAVLFTKNLWPETLLVGQVESRLYLNPFAHRPYSGILTKLDTYRFEGGPWQRYPGKAIHELLQLGHHDSSSW